MSKTKYFHRLQPTTVMRAVVEAAATVSWSAPILSCVGRWSHSRPFFLFSPNCLIDDLYDNNAAGPAANATDPSDTSDYSAFFPDGSNASATPAPAHTHTPGDDGGANNAGNYKTMPPPADKESPYSYGYGEEKKKILTQNEGQGDNYSMYSTAYPSSVTGGQGYSNYGEY